MGIAPSLIYRLLHRDYAESFMHYKPQTEDLYDLVQTHLPEYWNIRRQDMWFYCSPRSYTPPLQGWKIHMSATVDNCREVLYKATSVLFKYTDVSFKFALDYSLVSLINNKNWPRGASGKFITIYSSNSRRFLELIDEINTSAAGLQGPYILSDHRYKNSRVLFYRYGGMRMQTVLNVKGEQVPILKGPDGSIIPDQRRAYPVLPSWEAPILPVENGEEARSNSPSLSAGRYTIDKAITFSSAGGVYYARDNRTGKKVVVKEARPCINAMDDYDAVDLLKKEHRLLTVVADAGISPQPIDLFQEWENWFLVEEFIEGTALNHHSAANNILLRTRATSEERDEWCAMFGGLCEDLIRILRTLHSRNIVFADLSPNNLIVATDGQKLKIVDFEGAHQLGVDHPADIYTPGFVSRRRLAGEAAGLEDDYYAAGAVLLAYLLPINGLLHLDPEARQRFLAFIQEGAQLPHSMVKLINGLMDHPEDYCSEQGDGFEVVESIFPTASGDPVPEASHPYKSVIDGIVTHLSSAAEYGRHDRLYPSDPKIFSTNPLSLAYGAAGVAYALYKLTGELPEAAVDWMLQHQISSADYPPGLYVGLSGVAWSLLDMGMTDPAEHIFKLTFTHPLVYENPDLFYGMAGWGMTAIRFFRAMEKELYLDQAKKAAKRLLATSKMSERGYYWNASKECRLGLAHGSSGVALFLLYLYLATKDEQYLAAGSQALDFDLAAAVSTRDGGLSWGESLESPSPLYPYWRFGSAGIGMVTARFQRILGCSRYQSILDQIFIDTDRQYAVFPGRFAGLAGMGEFLLDMHSLRGDNKFLHSANKVAQALMPFRVNRGGTAFPGELLSRLCCDYGTGSAGVALFLNRLLGNQHSDFMLDELFQSSGSGHADSAPLRESTACGSPALVVCVA